MKGNGLVVWVLGGVGVILMYAAYTNSTLGEILAGKSGASISPKPATGSIAKTLSAAGNAAGTVAGKDATNSINGWLNSAAGKAAIAADANAAADKALSATPSAYFPSGSASDLVPAQYASNPNSWTGA